MAYIQAFELCCPQEKIWLYLAEKQTPWVSDSLSPIKFEELDKLFLRFSDYLIINHLKSCLGEHTCQFYR